MSENTVNAALRTMGYDTKVDICGHGLPSTGTPTWCPNGNRVSLNKNTP
jgi:hypothetical protein